MVITVSKVFFGIALILFVLAVFLTTEVPLVTLGLASLATGFLLSS